MSVPPVTVPVPANVSALVSVEHVRLVPVLVPAPVEAS